MKKKKHKKMEKPITLSLEFNTCHFITQGMPSSATNLPLLSLAMEELESRQLMTRKLHKQFCSNL